MRLLVVINYYFLVYYGFRSYFFFVLFSIYKEDELFFGFFLKKYIVRYILILWAKDGLMWRVNGYLNYFLVDFVLVVVGFWEVNFRVGFFESFLRFCWEWEEVFVVGFLVDCIIGRIVGLCLVVMRSYWMVKISVEKSSLII